MNSFYNVSNNITGKKMSTNQLGNFYICLINSAALAVII